MERQRGHRHLAIVRRTLEQRHGVPYEVERVVCPLCGLTLRERAVRTVRALAA
jgi:hypothetical protein